MSKENDPVFVGQRDISSEVQTMVGQQTGKPKLDPVVKNKVTIPKPTATQKAKAKAKEIGTSTFKNVLIPALKKLLWDASYGALASLFGQKPTTGYSNPYSPPWATSTPWSQYWAQPMRSDWVKPAAPSAPQMYTTPSTVRFVTEADAMTVLSTLMDLVARDGEVTVGQFKELIGERPNHTDYTYGWRVLNGSNVVRSGEGFYISFPPTVVLDR